MPRFLTIICILSISFLAAAVAQQPAPTVTARGDWTADARNSWSDDGEPRLQLNLRLPDSYGSWGSGVRFSELQGLAPGARDGMAQDARFSWTREAGTFRFEGTFHNGQGVGTFTFSANPAFATGMAGLGYRNLSTDQLLRLAIIDVTQSFVTGIAQVGYPSLPIDELVRMRIHGATPEFVRAMQSAGYTGLS